MNEQLKELLEILNKRLDLVNQRLELLSERIDSEEKLIDAVTTQLGEFSKRLERIEGLGIHLKSDVTKINWGLGK